MEAFVGGFLTLADPGLLFIIFVATLGGVLVGALPGLNGTTGAALLLPFTLTMEPVAAIAALTTVYCAATFAGAITAILINTPGTSASATTCLRGAATREDHPLVLPRKGISFGDDLVGYLWKLCVKHAPKPQLVDWRRRLAAETLC